jgi:hypothetical protein
MKYGMLAVALVAEVLQAQSPDTVPAVLLPLADRAPLEFATMLATVLVPSGVELRETDDVYVAGHPEFTPATRFDLQTRIPADTVVDAFNASHTDYRAMWLDGVFIVRPKEGRVEFLDTPSTLAATITITGAMDAARRILCQLDATLCSGGVGGSQLGSMAAAGFFDLITLDGTNHPLVIHTLNQLVRQSPRAWNVVTRKEQGAWHIVRYGLIHAYGQRTIQGITRQ